MEEKNKKEAKVLKPDFKKSMNDANAPKAEELTYEQLKTVASNLKMQCDQLYQRLQEAQRVIGSFNDIGMLLSILDKSDYFSESFVSRCSEKIEGVVSSMLDKSEEAEKAEK